MWDIVINELRELVVTVLVALLSLGAAYALAYIRRAKEALDARIDHVSTHAPARGATNITIYTITQPLFQPTHPHGVRQRSMML